MQLSFVTKMLQVKTSHSYGHIQGGSKKVSCWHSTTA